MQRDVLQVLGIRGSRRRAGDKEECRHVLREQGPGPRRGCSTYMEQEYFCSEGSRYYALAFFRHVHTPAAHMLTLNDRVCF
jgi:hypothetical protein